MRPLLSMHANSEMLFLDTVPFWVSHDPKGDMPTAGKPFSTNLSTNMPATIYYYFLFFYFFFFFLFLLYFLSLCVMFKIPFSFVTLRLVNAIPSWLWACVIPCCKLYFLHAKIINKKREKMRGMKKEKRRKVRGMTILCIKMTKRASAMDQYSTHTAPFLSLILFRESKSWEERGEEDVEVIVQGLSFALLCECCSSHLYDPDMHLLVLSTLMRKIKWI